MAKQIYRKCGVHLNGGFVEIKPGYKPIDGYNVLLLPTYIGELTAICVNPAIFVGYKELSPIDIAPPMYNTIAMSIRDSLIRYNIKNAHLVYINITDDAFFKSVEPLYRYNTYIVSRNHLYSFDYTIQDFIQEIRDNNNILRRF